jgi:hypothetical protein
MGGRSEGWGRVSLRRPRESTPRPYGFQLPPSFSRPSRTLYLRKSPLSHFLVPSGPSLSLSHCLLCAPRRVPPRVFRPFRRFVSARYVSELFAVLRFVAVSVEWCFGVCCRNPRPWVRLAGVVSFRVCAPLGCITGCGWVAEPYE